MGCNSSSSSNKSHDGSVSSAMSVVASPLKRLSLSLTLNSPATFSNCYRIGKKIGNGTFSQVFISTRISDGTRFAVKIIDKKFFEQKGGIKLDSFNNEIRLHKLLVHPNIVRFVDHFETDTEIQIIFEMMEGGPLLERISRKDKYSEKDARDIFLSLSSAIKHCHNKNIVHR